MAYLCELTELCQRHRPDDADGRTRAVASLRRQRRDTLLEQRSRQRAVGHLHHDMRALKQLARRREQPALLLTLATALPPLGNVQRHSKHALRAPARQREHHLFRLSGF
jgi:hypothetical protein